jgi:hypothetical protein
MYKHHNRRNNIKKVNYRPQYSLLKKNSIFASSFETCYLFNEKDNGSIIDLDSMLTQDQLLNSSENGSVTISIEPDVLTARNTIKSSVTSPKDAKISSIQLETLVIDIRLVLNISGRKFQANKNTLEYFPGTLLGNSSDRLMYYDEKRKEYFFERHAICFESILYFYQSRGRLYRPKDVPIDIFIEELEFFKFDRDIIMELMQRENLHLLPIAPDTLPHNKHFRSIWLFFEHPTTLCAKLVSVISALVIIISVVCACLETVDFSMLLCAANSSNCSSSIDAKILYDVFFSIEIICNILFLIEFLFRIISSPVKMKFLTNFLNLLDLFILITYIIINIIIFTSSKNHFEPKGTKVVTVLRILKLVRVIRLFKLTKYTKLLQVLVLTLWASKQAIIILISTITIGVILFSSLIYYAEYNEEERDFQSIPHWFWYTINVMTTVGDSDGKPKTILGKCFAAACALTGIVVIAIPIPVIVSNFNRYYQVLIENRYSETSRTQVAQKDDEPMILY